MTEMADYVDIRYVLYCIEEHKKVADGCSDTTREISDLIHNQLIDVTKYIPVVDVVPVRHGCWIEREDMYYGWNIWECSVCREEFCVEEGTPKDNEYNYCPSCGAKMDGDA